MDSSRHLESDVTAVVLTTGEATTAEALAALRRQTLALRELVVVEDVHYADDATVDMLAFLSRRIAISRDDFRTLRPRNPSY